jgi:hypothetical protein
MSINTTPLFSPVRKTSAVSVLSNNFQRKEGKYKVIEMKRLKLLLLNRSDWIIEKIISEEAEKNFGNSKDHRNYPLFPFF